MSTLGKSTISDSYGHRITEKIRQEAETARNLAGYHPSIELKAHATSLEILADFVVALPQANQLLRAIQRAELGRGIARDRFQPGPTTRRFLAQVGLGGISIIDAAEAFEELVSVCIDDLADQQDEIRAEARRQAERAATEAARAERTVSELADLTESEGVWHAKAIELESEVRHLAAQVDHAVAALEDPDKGEDAAKVSSALSRAAKADGGSRRQRHPDVSNLYFHNNAEGKSVYELGWREDGKQRWRTVGTELEEALEARGKLVEAGLIREPAESAV